MTKPACVQIASQNGNWFTSFDTIGWAAPGTLLVASETPDPDGNLDRIAPFWLHPVGNDPTKVKIQARSGLFAITTPGFGMGGVAFAVTEEQAEVFTLDAATGSTRVLAANGWRLMVVPGTTAYPDNVIVANDNPQGSWDYFTITATVLDGMEFPGEVFGEGLSFDGVSMQQTDFTGAKFTGASFVGCNMNGALLKNCNIVKHCVFDTATLVGADLSTAVVSDASFVGCDFSQAKLVAISGAPNFSKSKLESADLTNARITDAVFVGCTYSASGPHTLFVGADVSWSAFAANCSGVNLSGATLHGWRPTPEQFLGWNASNSVLSGALDASGSAPIALSLSGVVFAIDPTSPKFVRPSFAGSDVSNIDFFSAKLKRADFSNANLTGCNFTHAELTGASFASAYVTSAPAIFDSATMKDVDMKGFQGESCSFVGAILHGHDLDMTSAFFANASFVQAVVCQSDFTGVSNGSLHGANFQGAQMMCCNLSGLDLGSTKFESALLQGAQLAASKGGDFTAAVFSSRSGVAAIADGDGIQTSLSWDATDFGTGAAAATFSERPDGSSMPVPPNEPDHSDALFGPVTFHDDDLGLLLAQAFTQDGVLSVLQWIPVVQTVSDIFSQYNITLSASAMMMMVSTDLAPGSTDEYAWIISDSPKVLARTFTIGRDPADNGTARVTVRQLFDPPSSKVARRTMHFDLSHLAADDREFVFVSLADGVRRTLRAHDEHTLRAARRRSGPTLGRFTDKQLTHFLDQAIELPDDRLAYWTVQHGPKGDPRAQRNPGLFGVRVPDHGRATRAARRAGHEVHELGSVLDTAVSMVMHSHEILTTATSPIADLDPVGIINAIVRQEPQVVFDLASTIRVQGDAWAASTPIVDEKGQPILLPDPNDPQHPVPAAYWKYSDQTNAALTDPLLACIATVRNDPRLEQWLWSVGKGAGNRQVSTVDSGLFRAVRSELGDDTITYTQSDEGSQDGFAVSLDTTSSTNRSFTFRVVNKYMRWVSVSVLFENEKGEQINPELEALFDIDPADAAQLADPAHFTQFFQAVSAPPASATAAPAAFADVFATMASVTLSSSAQYYAQDGAALVVDGPNRYVACIDGVGVQVDKRVFWTANVDDDWLCNLWSKSLSQPEHRLIGCVEGSDPFLADLGSYQSKKFTLTMPPGANTCRVVISGLGLGDTPEKAKPAIVYTVLFNFALPLFLLASATNPLGVSQAARGAGRAGQVAVEEVEPLLGAIDAVPDAAPMDQGVELADLGDGVANDDAAAADDNGAPLVRRRIRPSAGVNVGDDLLVGRRRGVGRLGPAEPMSGELVLKLGEAGVSILLSNPTISAAIALAVAGSKLIECCPIVGQIFLAASQMLNAAMLAASTAEVLLSPAQWYTKISASFACDLTVNRDPRNDTFPKTARFSRVIVTFNDGTPPHDTGAEPFQRDELKHLPWQVTVPDLPASGIFRVKVLFYAMGPDGQAVKDNPVGLGYSGYFDASKTASHAVSMTITEKLTTLDANTTYGQYAKLGWSAANSAHSWSTSAPAPTATSGTLDPTGASTTRLAAISRVDFTAIAEAGAVTATWLGPSLGVPAKDAPTPANVMYMTEVTGDASDGIPASFEQSAPQGFVSPVTTVLEVDPPTAPPSSTPPTPTDPIWKQQGFQRAPYNIRMEPGAVNASNVRPYFARSLVIGQPIDVSQTTAYATMPYGVRDVAVHPDGLLVGTWFDASHAQLFIAKMPLTPVDQGSAPQPTSVAGYGTRIGFFIEPAFVGCTHQGTIIVLDQNQSNGATPCLQAFDKRGNPQYLTFTAAGAYDAGTRVPLRSFAGGLRVQYLDMAIESHGFVYVLLIASNAAIGQESPSDYHLDVYSPDGTFLVDVFRDNPIPCAHIAIDLFRNVYTANFETITGLNGRPEPSMSLLVPSVAAVAPSPTLASARAVDFRVRSESRVDLGTPAPIALDGNTPFTIEAIIRPLADSEEVGPFAQGVLFGRYDPTAAGTAPVSYAIYFVDGVLWGQRGNDKVSAPATSLVEVGDWYQVALTYDGANLALYLDGASVATTPSTAAVASSSQHTFIGGRLDPTLSNDHDFNGHVQRIAVISRALSATDVSNLHTALPPPIAEVTNGPNTVWQTAWPATVAYLDFSDEPAMDRSPSAISLTNFTGNVGYERSTTCVDLLGRDAINCGSHPLLDRTGSEPWTIESWLAPHGTRTTGTIFSRSRGGNVGFGLRVRGGQLVGFCGPVELVADRAHTLVEEAWTHVALTFDGSMLTLYANGVAIAGPLAAAGSMADNTAYIGGLGMPDDAVGDFLEAYLLEVRLWSTARTAEEILANRDNRPWIDGDMIAYWTFGGDGDRDLTGRHDMIVADDGMYEEVSQQIDAATARQQIAALREFERATREAQRAAWGTCDRAELGVDVGWFLDMAEQTTSVVAPVLGVLYPPAVPALAFTQNMLRATNTVRTLWSVANKAASTDPEAQIDALRDFLGVLMDFGFFDQIGVTAYQIEPKALPSWRSKVDRIIDALVLSVEASSALQSIVQWLRSNPTPAAAPSVVVTGTNTPLPEGATRSVSVALSVAPTESVTVALTARPSTAVLVTPATLTFTPSNYNIAQSVSISAPTRDATAAPPNTVSTAKLTCAPTGASGSTVYDRLNIEDEYAISVTVPSISVQVGELFREGESVVVPDGAKGRSFSFVLTEEPPEYPVTVSFEWDDDPNTLWVTPPTMTYASGGSKTQSVPVTKRRSERIANQRRTRSLSITAVTPARTLKTRAVTVVEEEEEEQSDILKVQSFYPGTGDCYAITNTHKVGDDEETKSLVCDGGGATEMRLNEPQLPAEIDYVCGTHIDDDHIVGLITLVQESNSIAQNAELWFNVPPPEPTATAAHMLARRLGASRPSFILRSLPHARDLVDAWETHVPRGRLFDELTGEPDGANNPTRHLPSVDIEFIGPTEANLERFNNAVDQVQNANSTRASVGGEIINRASIIFNVTSNAHGMRVLMTGDAWDRGQKRDIRGDDDQQFDIIKVPHHGSGLNRRKNTRSTSKDFFDHYTARRYLISCRKNRPTLPTADVLQWIVQSRKESASLAIRAAPFDIYVTSEVESVTDFLEDRRRRAYWPQNAGYGLWLLKTDADPTVRCMTFTWEDGELTETPEDLDQVTALTGG